MSYFSVYGPCVCFYLHLFIMSLSLSPTWHQSPGGRDHHFTHHGLWSTFSNFVVSGWVGNRLVPCFFVFVFLLFLFFNGNTCFLCKFHHPLLKHSHSICTLLIHNCELLFLWLSVWYLLSIEVITRGVWAEAGHSAGSLVSTCWVLVV